MKKRGQISFEYIVVIGILLVLLLPLLFYGFSTSAESIALVQTEDAVRSLAQAADEVYMLSPGSKKYTRFTLPKSTRSSIINGSEISVTLGTLGTNDIHAVSKAPLTGSIPSRAGIYTLAVEHLASGVVLIGTGNDTAPPTILWTAPRNLTCNPVTLRANTDEPATCKFGTVDTSYALLSTQMEGTSLGHSYNLGVQAEGTYQYYIRCQDPFGNTMNSSAVVSYSINFTYCNENDDDDDNQNNNGTDSTIVDLVDIGVDTAWYYKTNGEALATEDSAMVSWVNITSDLLDDNTNTPSNTYVIRTRNGDKYEGKVMLSFIDTSAYSKVVLYGRLWLIDESPFILRVYPYFQNGSINPANYSEFSINDSVLTQKVKWVQMDITPIAKMEDGFGWLRMRITALNLSNLNNDRLQFSELHYKVG